MAKHLNNKKFKRFLGVIDCFLILMLLASSVFLIKTLAGYRHSRARYQAVVDSAVSASTPSPSPSAEPDAPPAASAAPVRMPPIAVDFEALKKDTTRIKGWLYSSGTTISYPVMLGTNNEYYLTHAYDGTRDNGGSLFLDARTSSTLSDQNLIVYGHHMKDGSMFASLMDYQKQAYYEDHPSLYFLTPSQNYIIEVFAARTTKSDPDYFPCWFTSSGARESFYGKALSQSTIKTDVPYREDVQIISLVTCSYYAGFDDAKFQVHGFLVPLD